ncbi:MAG: hypothetical protein SOR57_02540 [Parabacteroides sp.]|nr:hypothetical protein [Parabacteroides sp.]
MKHIIILLQIFLLAACSGNQIYWAEGPTLLDLGSKYYVYFDKYTEGCFGVIESSDLKNWNEISDKLKMPEGIRHGSVLKVTEKELERLFDM